VLWQEIAENFYPERADFTVVRNLGDDYAQHLTTSYPLLCRRDLGDQVGVMLRPTNKPWFHMVPRDTRIEDNTSKRWLEWAEGTQRRAMYDRVAQFTRAAKEADHDFAAFGQCVESVELNRFRTALLYRCWHLKDVVWRENQDGEIDFVARKWRVALSDLIRYFPRPSSTRRSAARGEGAVRRDHGDAHRVRRRARRRRTPAASRASSRSTTTASTRSRSSRGIWGRST
jgi:hypothetical protein